MIKTALPRRRYNATDYANLDPNSIGKPIPIGYGTLTGIVPTEIDTTTHKWKILDQAVDEITQIRSATQTLVSAVDYSEDLALAEFTLLFNVMLSPAPTTYYFAIEGDYTISGTNYASFAQNDSAYANGAAYDINGSGDWGGAGSSDLAFVVWGKTSASASEAIIAQNPTPDVTADRALRDSAARTKIGQSFKLSGASAFATRIEVMLTHHGTIAAGKKIRLMLYSNTTGTQVGPDGTWLEIPAADDWVTDLGFPLRNENEVLSCDVKSPGTELTKVADIIPDIISTVMGKSAAILDATELANLDTDRTQDLKMFIENETTFGDVLAKLEAGQLWKLVPLQDGTYGTIVSEAGEPANTPHFRDDDFLSFKMTLDQDNLKHTVDVSYDEDETTGDFKTATASSDVAKFFYINEESMDVETYLSTYANAATLAADYLARFEVPVITCVFEVHGWALDLLPFRDKVKLTRTRAAYAGGTLSGVLFRIVKLVKRPENNTVEITCSVWGNSAT